MNNPFMTLVVRVDSLFVRVDGKNFQVRFISSDENEVNRFMEANPETALIDTMDGIHIVANIESEAK